MATSNFKVGTYRNFGPAGMPLPTERRYPVSQLVERLDEVGITVERRSGNNKNYVLNCQGLEIVVNKYEDLNTANKRQKIIGATVYHNRGYDCKVAGDDVVAVEKAERVLTEFYTGQKPKDTTSPEWNARLKEHFR